jgi:hypothetical protein
VTSRLGQTVPTSNDDNLIAAGLGIPNYTSALPGQGAVNYGDLDVVPGSPMDPGTQAATLKKNAAVGLLKKLGTRPGQTTPLTPQQQQAQQMRTAAITSGAAQAAQLGLQLIKSPSQIENRARLAELEGEIAAVRKRMAAGDYGYTEEERQLAFNNAMNPVAAQATQAQLNEEAALASMGSTSSAADIVRARREQRGAVRDAALQASTSVELGSLRRASEQAAADAATLSSLRDEKTSRTAARTAEQQQILSSLGRMAADSGAIFGKIQAAKGIEELDMSGMSEAERALVMNAYKSGDPDASAQTLALIRLLAERGDAGNTKA